MNNVITLQPVRRYARVECEDGMGLQLHWLEPLDLVRLHRFVANRLVGLEAA